MTLILCDVEQCQYHVFFPKNPLPYRHQCCEDEIEIDWIDPHPICYSFKRKPIKGEKMTKGMKIMRGIK